MKNDSFQTVLNANNLYAWNAIKEVLEGVLSGKKKRNDSTLIERLVLTMMDAFKTIDVHMSLKIHLLHFHYNKFQQQLSTESDEHGERYHQVALPFEFR